MNKYWIKYIYRISASTPLYPEAVEEITAYTANDALTIFNVRCQHYQRLEARVSDISCSEPVSEQV